MQNSTALPSLRMLPTALLIPHEDYDPRRAEKLSRRILEEGLLKNPPVVAAIPGTERFVVLDGANRTMAFQAAGIPHIVAQLVSYDDPGVILDTWYHVVSNMALEDFEQALLEVAGMRLHACELEQARRALEVGQAAAYIVCDSGVRQVIPTGDRNLSALQLLKDVVATYRGKADIFRASNDIWEIQKPFYPKIMALVVFPRLKPADILSAAANGEKVPSGITRHVIPTRALNINIPIGILMADWSLERKRAWLDEWWMERMAANAIRYYAESTFSFNE
ncbi:MAG: hypothetical protein JXA78_09345 [Anaerolineales bacterium]|nr:hypothetical protein [Anaerolineales bacterium]